MNATYGVSVVNLKSNLLSVAVIAVISVAVLFYSCALVCFIDQVTTVHQWRLHLISKTYYTIDLLLKTQHPIIYNFTRMQLKSSQNVMKHPSGQQNSWHWTSFHDIIRRQHQKWWIIDAGMFYIYRERMDWKIIPVWSPRSGSLTHWGRVTHICVSKITIIGSDNGLTPGRRQAIIWTNAGILLIWNLGTNFNEILSEIHTFSFKKNAFKNVVCTMASISSRPQCVKEVVNVAISCQLMD